MQFNSKIFFIFFVLDFCSLRKSLYQIHSNEIQQKQLFFKVILWFLKKYGIIKVIYSMVLYVSFEGNEIGKKSFSQLNTIT